MNKKVEVRKLQIEQIDEVKFNKKLINFTFNLYYFVKGKHKKSFRKKI